MDLIPSTSTKETNKFLDFILAKKNANKSIYRVYLMPLLSVVYPEERLHAFLNLQYTRSMKEMCACVCMCVSVSV